MGRDATPDPVTLVYKTIPVPSPGSDGEPSEIKLHLDVYLPNPHLDDVSAAEGDHAGVPAVVYFHGGGLLVGNRKSWFPEWLHRRLDKRGIAFLSADYRLLVPSTGHEIVEDIQDLFAYIHNNLNIDLTVATGDTKIRVNTDAIAVAGSSAGGLCGYLCAMHLSTKPRALLSIYGQAGECLTDLFLEPKSKPWLPGRPLVDPCDFVEFIFPQSMSLPVIADSPLKYYPPTHPTPGLPATDRMYLTRLYYQLGEWLDYYTGDHTLSARLRQWRSTSSSISATEPSSVPEPTKVQELIGEKNIKLFPQFGVAGDWPPTFFIHGSEDAQVQLLESKHLVEKLSTVGVESELIIAEGQPHTFDYAPDAEKEFGRLFDQAAAFLARKLQK